MIGIRMTFRRHFDDIRMTSRHELQTSPSPLVQVKYDDRRKETYQVRLPLKGPVASVR